MERMASDRDTSKIYGIPALWSFLDYQVICTGHLHACTLIQVTDEVLLRGMLTSTIAMNRKRVKGLPDGKGMKSID